MANFDINVKKLMYFFKVKFETKKIKMSQLRVRVDLLTLELTLKKSKSSKSNLWDISSWQDLQFDVLIDKSDDLYVDLLV